MDNLLIISKNQFGYLTDVYKWTEYLKDLFNVSVICYDVGLEKCDIDRINIHYVSYKGPLFLRGMRFLIVCILYVLLHKGKIIIVYFEHCEWIKRILFWKRIQLDIRTLSVSESENTRIQYDTKLSKACNYFDVISVISKGVGDKLNLKNAYNVLPLGADVMSHTDKKLNKIHLVYVGTFHNRRIQDTIKGLYLFLKQYSIEVKYDIIGSGSKKDECQIMDTIYKYNLQECIHYYGRLSHSDLTVVFDKANIGVSYVPITSYFEYQPPTKTFEYVLSGLFCIATKTKANAEVINEKNGVLIDDSPEGFCEALSYIYENKSLIQMGEIRSTLIDYLWPNIVNLYLLPLLK